MTKHRQLRPQSAPRIVSLGCRLNSHDAQVMQAHAEQAGLRDVIFVNSCAVTAEAVRQSAQTVRRLRRENPKARIIVTGCAAQIAPDRFAAMAEVDGVLGTEDKLRPESFTALAEQTAPRVLVSDVMATANTPLPAQPKLTEFGGRSRATVKIQTGCDHRCTFCIIPFTRGPSRSVPPDDVIAQIRLLTEKGFGEVVLTGVDIAAYGKDLSENLSLGGLVLRILDQVPALPRLRLSSLDVIQPDPELERALAEQPRLMPHLHLSLQAGDDMILKRMRRRHSRAEAVALCARLRALRPDIAIGADLIAGFPTETEEMAENSRRLIADCGLAYLHVFPFSPRPGTPAARMPQLPGDVVRARAARLRAMGEAAKARFLAQWVGQTVELLMETDTVGRTPHFAQMQVTTPAQPGVRLKAKVTGVSDGKLQGAALS